MVAFTGDDTKALFIVLLVACVMTSDGTKFDPIGRPALSRLSGGLFSGLRYPVKNPAILALRWNNMELRVMQQFPISGPMRIDIEQQGETCVLHCRGRFVAGQDQEYMQS